MPFAYFREEPWKDYSLPQVIVSVTSQQQTLSIPSQTPPEIAKIMKKCFSFSPNEREDFEWIVKEIEKCEEEVKKEIELGQIKVLYPLQHNSKESISYSNYNEIKNTFSPNNDVPIYADESSVSQPNFTPNNQSYNYSSPISEPNVAPSNQFYGYGSYLNNPSGVVLPVDHSHIQSPINYTYGQPTLINNTQPPPINYTYAQPLPFNYTQFPPSDTPSSPYNNMDPRDYEIIYGNTNP